MSSEHAYSCPEDSTSQRHRAADGPDIVVAASARIPTPHGNFRFLVFHPEGDPHTEHVAVVSGAVEGGEDVLVRMHSECLTSEVLGSLRCDCAEQLEHALAAIGKAGRGVVLYLRQEGRGIGLANKIRAYALQETGLDTVDANRALGLPDDARRYDGAAAMIGWLGIRSVRLLTNNPDKLEALSALGIRIEGREPVVVAPTMHSHGYLAAKRTRMAHWLPR